MGDFWIELSKADEAHMPGHMDEKGWDSFSHKGSTLSFKSHSAHGSSTHRVDSDIDGEVL